MATLTRFHDLSTRLLAVEGLQPLLGEILDAAIAMMGAGSGMLQLVEGDSLRIVAHHGCQPAFLKFFAFAKTRTFLWVQALQRGERVTVEDVEHSPLVAGMALRNLLLDAGVRATLFLPLLTRHSGLFGVLFLYWSAPHAANEQDLDLLDLLARRAVDLIAHEQARETLQEALQAVKENRQAETEELRTVSEMLDAKQEELDQANADRRTQAQELGRQAGDLYAHRERLALAVSGARMGMYEWDVLTGQTLWTEPVLRLLGLRPTTTTTTTTTTTLPRVYHYQDWARRVHPEDLPRVEAELHRCMTERLPYEMEYRVVWPDDSVHWIADRGVFQDEPGTCTRLLGILMDISERKGAEEALHASEERLALAVSGTRIGIYEWNVVTGESLWTEQVAKLLGLDVTASSRPHPYRDWADRIHPEDRARVEARVRRCMAERTAHESEYRIVWPDGSVHWVVSRGVFQYDSQGCCTRLLGMIMDITERKQAEQILRIKDNAIASSLNAIAMADEQGYLTYVNPAFLTLWGYQDDGDVLGKSVLDFWKEPSQAAEVIRAIQNGQGWTGELVAVRKDGTCPSLYLSASAVLNDAGVPICIMASFMDITERKAAEEALRESEARFSTIFHASPIAIALVQLKGGLIADVNESWQALTGYSRAEALGRAGPEFGLWVHPQQRACLIRKVQEGGPVREEVQLRHKSGEYRDVIMSVVLVKLAQGVHFLTMASDITDRKRAEEGLRESEERFRRYFELGLVGLAITSPAKGWIEVNDECCRLLGHERDELLQKTWAELTHPDDLTADVMQFERVMAGQIDGYTMDKRFVRKDGQIVDTMISVTAMHGADGAVDYFLALLQDVTERKQAEQALRQLNATLENKVAQRTAELERQRQRLYAVLESIPAMVCLLTPDYHVAFANRSFREKFGESHGRPCYEFCYGRTEPCDFCETYNVLKTGKPHRWEVTSRDGQTIIDAHDFPFTDVDGSPLILEMDLDITERKRAEGELKQLNEALAHRARQLQKLTLELSRAEERERRRIAVILHEDLQQQIAGAKLHLSLARSRTREDPQRAAIEAVDEMLRGAIEKSRSLSHDLSPAVVHMNDLTEALQWLVQRVQAQHALTVQVEAPGEMTLRSEAMTIFLFRAAQELLFNVVKHAGVTEAALRVRRCGRHVCLRVSDQGQGFDPQELQNASGFGLLSIRERVELLGGRMKIESVRGQGSTFRIIVPENSE